MRPHLLPLTLALAAAAACSSDESDPLAADVSLAGLEVTLPQTTYARSDLDITSGPGVRARIVNGTAQPYYSRLGDAFNGAVEQDPLWVATGSDGALERADGAAWAAVEGVFLVEGVREVTLRTGKSNELIAHAPPGVAPGRYRIVVALRPAPGAAVAVRVASPTFEVR